MRRILGRQVSDSSCSVTVVIDGGNGIAEYCMILASHLEVAWNFLLSTLIVMPLTWVLHHFIFGI